MRRTILLGTVALVAAMMLLGLSQAPASSATQEEQPDTSCQGESNTFAVVSQTVSQNVKFAQTFTALSTGNLTTVEVPVQDSNNAADLVVEVRTVDVSGVPTNTVLASTSIPASQIPDSPLLETVAVSFNPSAEVVAGRQYALVLRATEGGFFLWGGSNQDPCPGQSYSSSHGFEFTPSLSHIDLVFSAFVTPLPPPEPKTACNDGRDNDGDGRTDLRDPGCENRRDDSERNRTSQPECTIKGNDRANTLRGTDKRDVICGFGGNDTIQGRGGNDLILGNAGNDTIQGGNGDDTIYGGDGEDTIQGGDGNDRIYGGRRGDTIQGNDGKDTLRGGAGDDTIQGGAGDDDIDGGAGDDTTQQ